MATSRRTGRRLSTEAMASVTAAPALGPSLGTAPAGKWTWRSLSLKSWALTPNESARERTKESAASTDSRITSPNCPVTVSFPDPGMRRASMVMMSPPNEVQARPVTVPTSGSLSASSAEYFGTPRMRSTMALSTTHAPSSPSAFFRARLRMSAEMLRSKLRSPASREYRLEMTPSTSSVNWMSVSVMPCSSSSRGRR